MPDDLTKPGITIRGGQINVPHSTQPTRTPRHQPNTPTRKPRGQKPPPKPQPTPEPETTTEPPEPDTEENSQE